MHNERFELEISIFTDLFERLDSTNSRLLKEYYVSKLDPTFRNDWMLIVETLAGKHPLGYTLYKTTHYKWHEFGSFKEVLDYLCEPRDEHDLSEANIIEHCMGVAMYADFLAPIVNRTLRLGIGRSLLEKTSTTPMLAAKYEFGKLPGKVYVTEKLDGNRCVAMFENGEWKFLSRSGKEMHVSIDMSGLPDAYVYDGEIMLRSDTELSIRRSHMNDIVEDVPDFNKTTGVINSHTLNKDIVYNIFDVVDNVPYSERREFLDSLTPRGNVRILPVLAILESNVDQEYAIYSILNNITDNHGEGIMLNIASATYQHKRTKDLLKVKKVQTMDMRVVSIDEGHGKYEFLVGALKCTAESSDGKVYFCDVGTGLSDEQRSEWALHPEKIVDKIVEVAYFGVSQGKLLKDSDFYSLRFPRLKRVREDKTETSEY